MMKRRIQPYTRVSEAVISSRLPTDLMFDKETIEAVLNILRTTASRILGKNMNAFLKMPLETQKALIVRFAKNIVEPLNRLPNFRFNKVGFEVGDIGEHQSVFGNGYQHVYWNIIGIIVNTTVLPEVIATAVKDNFDKEILRLRSVVRHEIAHKLHMEKIHIDPTKRIQKRRFTKAIIAPSGSHEYYGIPSEIIAHANHTVEMMVHGHEAGWREVIANYVLADSSRGHRDTKKFIRTIVKLLKDYNAPFTTRLQVKRNLMQLATKMRLRIPELEKEATDLRGLRNELTKTGFSPEESKEFDTVRLRHDQGVKPWTSRQQPS